MSFAAQDLLDNAHLGTTANIYIGSILTRVYWLWPVLQKPSEQQTDVWSPQVGCSHSSLVNFSLVGSPDPAGGVSQSVLAPSILNVISSGVWLVIT